MGEIEKIQHQIQEITNELDQEVLLERQMNTETFDITNALYKHQLCTYKINDLNLEIRFIRNTVKDKTVLTLYVFDIHKMMIATTKYRPACFELYFNRDKSEYDNLKDLVYTMVCYHHDAIRPEEIEDEDD